MRLLVVEDEKSIAEAIQALLADKGYSVDLAFDGDDGLEYILTGLYDLVLVGYYVTQTLRIICFKKSEGSWFRNPNNLFNCKITDL